MRRTFLVYLVTLFATCSLFDACNSKDDPILVNCSLSDLMIVVEENIDPTTCSSFDGEISVSAVGGEVPYTFSNNAGPLSAQSVFQNLGGGDYILTVRDRVGCEKSVLVTLTIPGINPLIATLTLDPDTDCLGGNGSITVQASGGAPPYQYKLGLGPFSDQAVFNGLQSATYTLTVKDTDECQLILGAVVSAGGTGTSLTNEIKPIISSKCAISTCHGGSQSPNLSTNQNIINNAQAIKREISSGRMPPSGQTGLTLEQKTLIICWVDDGANNN